MARLVIKSYTTIAGAVVVDKAFSEYTDQALFMKELDRVTRESAADMAALLAAANDRINGR